MNVLNMTAQNKSSKLQDVYAGRETEINYVNGCLVARGEQLGLNCDQNHVLIKIITAETQKKGD